MQTLAFQRGQAPDQENQCFIFRYRIILRLVKIHDQIGRVLVLPCALCAGYIIIFEYIHTLSAEHSVVVGGGEGIGDALLIPDPVPAVQRLSVYRIAGDAEGVIPLRHQRDIVPTSAVAS